MPAPDPDLLAQVRERTWTRLARFGMAGHAQMSASKYHAGRFELLSALAFPDADPWGLDIVNDFHLYLFYVDDQAEEDPAYGKQPERLRQYFEAHVAAIRDGAPCAENDGAGRLLGDLRARLRTRASEAWLARFAHSIERYLMDGTLPAARHWTAATVPGLAEYRSQRAFDSAVFCMQDLYEPTSSGELPEWLRTRADFAELRLLCTNVVAFANDLVSYPKEVRRNGSPNNLVHVMMLRERLSLGRAIARVISLVNDDVAKFDRIVAELPRVDPDTDARLARYVRGQRAFMHGNVAWSLASGRYVDPTSPFLELRGDEPELLRSA